MDSKVKCVALDLDGTLLSDEKKVSEENREALMRAAEKGVHIVIAHLLERRSVFISYHQLVKRSMYSFY